MLERKSLHDGNTAQIYIDKFVQNILLQKMSPKQQTFYDGLANRKKRGIASRFHRNSHPQYHNGFFYKPMKIDYYIAAHNKYGVHHKKGFLSWHRLFLQEFEKDLDMPIPYWNWAKNPEIPTEMLQSTLKLRDFMEFDDPSNPYDSANLHDPFDSASEMSNPEYAQKYFMFLTRDDENITLQRESQLSTADCLRLLLANFTNKLELTKPFRFRNDFEIFLEGHIVAWTRQKDMMSRLTRNIQIPFQFHDEVHGTIGGHMGLVPYSPFDPIFWCHHCFVDRIWSDFHNFLSVEERKKLYRTAPKLFVRKLKPYLVTKHSDIENTFDLNYKYSQDELF